MGCFGGSSEKDPEVQDAQKELAENPDGFDGPLKKRHCKDIFWLLLFVAFWIGMIVVAAKAFTDGNPARFLNGQDSWANVCGQVNEQYLTGQENSGLDMTDRPYLYNTQPSEDDGIKICVAKCPKVSGAGQLACDPTVQNCLDAGVCISQAPYTISNSTTATDKSNSGCPPSIYNAKALASFYSICYPTAPTASISAFFIQAADKIITSVDSMELVTEALQDLDKSKFHIIYSELIAVGLCLSLIIMTRCFTWPIVWLSILGTNAVLVGFAYLSGSRFFALKSEFDAQKANSSSLTNDPNLESQKTWYMALFIASTIFAVIILLVTLALRKRVGLAIELIKEASKVIVTAPMLLLQPLWTYIWIFAMLAYFVAVTLWLSTSKTPILNADTGHASYVQVGSYQEMFWYNLFGVIWTIQFFSACSQIIIAGTIANWYFTRKRDLGVSLYFRAYKNLVFYHMGTAAFGSLIITIIQLLRIICEHLKRKSEAEGTGDITKFIFRCIGCCLWCFEKCIKFLNKNAYIEVAIYGYSFCTAAREAFKVIFRNIIRLAVVNFISWFVFFIIKLLVAGGAMLSAYWMLQNDASVAYPGAIILLCGVVGFIIGDVFVGVFDMAIESLFVCFAEDIEQNVDKGKEPFAPKSLQKYMDKHKLLKAKEKEDKKEDKKEEEIEMEQKK